MAERWIKSGIIAFSVAIIGGCDRDRGGSSGTGAPAVDAAIRSTALPARTPTDGQLFESLSASITGVDFVNPLDLAEPRKYLYNSPFISGGVCIGDADGDGRLDLYFTNGPRANRLFRQTGPMRFTDITDHAGVGGGDAWAAGAAMVDIDGDGDLDIYVANYDSPNQLFINDGHARFVESAAAFGLDTADASLMPAFCDYDGDGDLDLYLVTNQFIRPGGKPAKPPVERRDGKLVVQSEFERFYRITEVAPHRFEADVYGRDDYLYRNNGDGTFTDVTEQAGIHGDGFGLSAVWWDFNGDGRPDLYVANDYLSADRLYENNGDGTFTDAIARTLPHTAWFSMGADAADINNDGRLDLMTTDMAATTHFKAKIAMGDMADKIVAIQSRWPRQIMRNSLFVNTGTRRFTEAANLAGVAKTDWTWGVRLDDYDEDGRVDLLITNGAARQFNHSDIHVDPAMLIGHNTWDFFENEPVLNEQNFAFRNGGDLRFENVSARWGFDHVGVSSAIAQGDLDGDGDPDLVVVNLGEPVSIYRNRSADGHCIVVRLEGKAGNSHGVGAVVRIDTAAGPQVRQISPMTGYLSCGEAVAHFGLGKQRTIARLTVQWPTGHTQTFDDLEADRLYTINEPSGAVASPPPVPPVATQFVEVAESIGLDVRHREREFDDFARQPLLPAKLSQLGPGVTVADADGDGDDDVFLPAASGDTSTLYLNDGGRFTPAKSQPWWDDVRAEDMAALFFDADGDGDLDLYVASGSVECEPNDPVLRDRLYLNDGHGGFTRAPESALPQVADSGSVVVAADFDADGDLDLFVGSRSVPGAYPVTPSSRLLQNEGGRFSDATDRLAPGLRLVGLVSGAIWSDADGDHRPDLLVATEWGPIHLFRNLGGRLEDATAAAGLDSRRGWWNSITGADIDADGDTDFIVMNAGLNTKYGIASPDHPSLLFYGEFDSTRTRHLVEAKPGDDHTLLPVRGRSCSSKAMPYLADKFPKFTDFAKATLTDIYTPDSLAHAMKLTADEFESGLLVNDGSGRFEFRALPRGVQLSPGYGVVTGDFDADGHADLYAVQNLYTREPETGIWRGGIGMMLRGDGKGAFEPVPPTHSGLVVDGDAKGLAVVDLDGDGWGDLIAAQNDGKPLVFKNRGVAGRRPLAVRLRQPTGNTAAAGARVTVTTDAGLRQSAEVYAGSGYLSQSSPWLFFAGDPSGGGAKIDAVWPDGTTTSHRWDGDSPRILIDRPGAAPNASTGASSR